MRATPAFLALALTMIHVARKSAPGTIAGAEKKSRLSDLFPCRRTSQRFALDRHPRRRGTRSGNGRSMQREDGHGWHVRMAAAPWDTGGGAVDDMSG